MRAAVGWRREGYLQRQQLGPLSEEMLGRRVRFLLVDAVHQRSCFADEDRAFKCTAVLLLSDEAIAAHAGAKQLALIVIIKFFGIDAPVCVAGVGKLPGPRLRI